MPRDLTSDCTLPPAVKQVIYRRLHDVLTGKDLGGAVAHLSTA